MAKGNGKRDQQADSILYLLDGILHGMRWSHHLTLEESEEIRSQVLLKWAAQDGNLARRLQDANKLRPYLRAITVRTLIDERNQRWGKWRPSARARRAGSLAMELERRTVRDRASLREAVGALLAHNPRFTESGLYALANDLPKRVLPREEALPEEDLLTSSAATDTRFLHREDQDYMQSVRRHLACQFAKLSEEDKAILKLRFEKGIRVADMGRQLGKNPRHLYRQIGRCLRKLRHGLEHESITKEGIRRTIRPWTLEESESGIINWDR